MRTAQILLRDRGFTEIVSHKGAAIAARSSDLDLATVYDKRGESIGVDWVRRLKSNTKSHACVLVIYSPAANNVSYLAKQELRACGAELFTDTMLAVPYVYSAYVPRHYLSSFDEVKSAHPTVQLEAMPTISYQDPVCKWFGWKPGSIIRVEQQFSNMCPYVTYERVTDAELE